MKAKPAPKTRPPAGAKKFAKGHSAECWRRTKARYAAEGDCRHCRQWKVSRPRGLCGSCYQCPAIRALYPSTSKFTPVYDSDFHHAAKPCAPTSAPAGSGLKIIAMQERASTRQELHHQGDNVALVNESRPQRATGEIGHRTREDDAAEYAEFIARRLPASLQGDFR